jgi:undecaprenyl-diphosphatase
LSIIEKILEKDKELLVFINALGSEQWDSFWLFVTNKFTWIPLYILLLYLLFKHYGWKKALTLVLLVALLVTFADQLVNLIKNYFQRLRPNKDPGLKNIIRIVKNSQDYSFVSGHATTSFAVSVFIILTLKKWSKAIFFILVWPILFFYSRMYLGVHYPLDVTSGLLLGVLIGYLFYRLSLWVFKRFEIRSKTLM